MSQPYHMKRWNPCTQKWVLPSWPFHSPPFQWKRNKTPPCSIEKAESTSMTKKPLSPTKGTHQLFASFQPSMMKSPPPCDSSSPSPKKLKANPLDKENIEPALPEQSSSSLTMLPSKAESVDKCCVSSKQRMRNGCIFNCKRTIAKGAIKVRNCKHNRGTNRKCAASLKE